MKKSKILFLFSYKGLDSLIYWENNGRLTCCGFLSFLHILEWSSAYCINKAFFYYDGWHLFIYAYLTVGRGWRLF